MCFASNATRGFSLQQLVEQIVVTVKAVFFSGHSIGLHVAQSFIWELFSVSIIGLD